MYLPVQHLCLHGVTRRASRETTWLCMHRSSKMARLTRLTAAEWGALTLGGKRLTRATWELGIHGGKRGERKEGWLPTGSLASLSAVGPAQWLPGDVSPCPCWDVGWDVDVQSWGGQFLLVTGSWNRLALRLLSLLQQDPTS